MNGSSISVGPFFHQNGILTSALMGSFKNAATAFGNVGSDSTNLDRASTKEKPDVVCEFVESAECPVVVKIVFDGD